MDLRTNLTLRFTVHFRRSRKKSRTLCQPGEAPDVWSAGDLMLLSFGMWWWVVTGQSSHPTLDLPTNSVQKLGMQRKSRSHNKFLFWWGVCWTPTNWLTLQHAVANRLWCNRLSWLTDLLTASLPPLQIMLQWSKLLQLFSVSELELQYFVKRSVCVNFQNKDLVCYC